MDNVRRFMSRRIVTIDKRAQLNDAIAMMVGNEISSLLVTDKSALVGILTERDLVKRLLFHNKNPKTTKVGDIMTSHVITISPDATIEEASFLMRSKRIKQLPVVDHDLIGIITQTDIVDETFSMSKRIAHFMFYQNIFSIIIIIFAIFLFVYLFLLS